MRIKLKKLRRIIRESLVDKDWAAVLTKNETNKKEVTVYDAGKLVAALSSPSLTPADWDDVFSSAGLGFIQIVSSESKEHGPCRGAWVVRYSYGPRLEIGRAHV